jgi:hypothetical protein
MLWPRLDDIALFRTTPAQTNDRELMPEAEEFLLAYLAA